MTTDVSAYKKLSDVEHVLLRPSMYVGSVLPSTQLTWLVDVEKQKMAAKRELTFIPGFHKLFDEIISNSIDESTRAGSNLDVIKVEIDRATGEISVYDNGGITVQKHPEYDEYIPTMIFGSLRAGNNFDDSVESSVAGQNGLGATLTNIFSTSFTVETSDGKNRFKQTWSDNMHKQTTPQIVEVEGKHYTKITFTPDYAHLKMTLDDDNYQKLVKRVYDAAGAKPNLKIYLNGERIKISSFKDYVAMYTDRFEYDETSDWQIGIASSDDGFQQVSFVNSTATTQGGTHVNYVWLQLAIKLREHILKKHKIEVKPSEIQTHMQIFINARINKPRYDSQTKENLMTEVKAYGTSWVPSERFIRKVIDSGVVDRVLLWAEARAKAEEIRRLKEINKDIDNVNHRRVEKFSDALEDDRRDLCELYLTEGDSARSSIQEARGKNPYIGSFALKGKPLNVMDEDLFKILGGKDKNKDKEFKGNNEIKNILKITGLKIGVPVQVDPDKEWIEVELNGKVQLLNLADSVYLDGKWVLVKDVI